METSDLHNTYFVVAVEQHDRGVQKKKKTALVEAHYYHKVIGYQKKK
jgi:hypothetical protein